MQADQASLIIIRRLVPFIAWAAGIFIYFHHTLLSAFQNIQGGQGDSRLINFILEHSYLWLRQIPPHTSFFDPPVFFPQANVSAYTDLLIGVAPLYWLWRFAGFEPDTAYQIWMLLLGTLNFAAAYLLLKRCFACGVIGSSIGSLLFAFNTAQYSKMAHQQLVPQFYLLLAIMALFTMLSDKRTSSSGFAKCLSLFVFFVAWTAQFYTSFYNTFFAGLALIMAFVWSLLIRAWRQRLLDLIGSHYICFGLATLLALILIWPGLSHYLTAADDVGFRGIGAANLAKIYSWILTGDNNLLYGWISQSWPFQDIKGDHIQGIGFLTLALSAMGLIRLRKRPAVQAIVLAVLTTAVLTTRITTHFDLWPCVREVVPGAQALRAVSRVGMLQLIPAAIGLASFFQHLRNTRKWSWLLILAGFCMLEQINIDHRYISKQALRDEISSLETRVASDCDAFFLISNGEKPFKVPELASWTTLATGKPTVNGRYGNFPPDYPQKLKRSQKRPGSVDRSEVNKPLSDWCTARGIPHERVQIIQLEQ